MILCKKINGKLANNGFSFIWLANSCNIFYQENNRLGCIVGRSEACTPIQGSPIYKSTDESRISFLIRGSTIIDSGLSQCHVSVFNILYSIVDVNTEGSLQVNEMNTSQDWCVLQLFNTMEKHVIPSNWLFSNQKVCAWPPHSSAILIKLLARQRKEPTEDWERRSHFVILRTLGKIII